MIHYDKCILYILAYYLLQVPIIINLTTEWPVMCNVTCVHYAVSWLLYSSKHKQWHWMIRTPVIHIVLNC